MTPSATRLTVVVLSCGDLGIQVANRLQALSTVERVVLVTAPYKRGRRSLAGKIRHVHRTQGWFGFGRIVWAKLRPLLGGRSGDDDARSDPPQLAVGVEHLGFAEFDAPECIEAI